MQSLDYGQSVCEIVKLTNNNMDFDAEPRPLLSAQKCLNRLTKLQKQGMITLGIVAILFAVVGVARASNTALIVAALVAAAGVVANLILANLSWKLNLGEKDNQFKYITVTLVNIAAFIGLVVVLIIDKSDTFAWAFVFVASAAILPSAYWLSSEPIGEQIQNKIGR